MTLKSRVPVLPCVSVEVQCTVVVPAENDEPLAVVQVTGPAASSGSVAVTDQVTTADWPAPTVAVWSPDGVFVITGGVVSAAWVTMTWKVSVPVLLCWSVEVQVTVVSPTGNCEPLAGLQLTAPAVSSGSVAVVVQVTWPGVVCV